VVIYGNHSKVKLVTMDHHYDYDACFLLSDDRLLYKVQELFEDRVHPGSSTPLSATLSLVRVAALLWRPVSAARPVSGRIIIGNFSP
jgi:hypothetical protein